MKESVKVQMKTIAKQYNMTAIIVTYDSEEAWTIFERALTLDRG